MARALRCAWLCVSAFVWGCGGGGPGGGDDGSLPCDPAACDDGQFCNGEETCDERGCLSGAPPCRSGERCDETADRCEPGCSDDLDRDGHVSLACGGDDCDDDDPDISPDATEVCDLDGVDEDCDPDTLAGVDGDADGDGFVATRCCNAGVCGNDCDDTQINVSPLAPDLCGDSIDNDCDGATDEGGVLYRDLDNDGRGDPATSITASCMPGWVANADDCDDSSQITFRGARERCDGRDNDCSLPGDMAGGPDPSEDMDGDLHSPPAATCLSRTELGADALGFEFPKNDCNDSDPTVYGGAEEICGNGIDENCNGTPDDPMSTVFRDADGDGHGTPTESMTITTCEVPSGWSRSNADCDDTRASRYGGALESCDRIDNDCSTPATIAAVEEDVDGDGFAPIGAACVGAGDAMAPAGAFPRSDCADSDPAAYPGATEVCDGVDRDCSSGGGVATDEDGDGDGHSPIGAMCVGLGEAGAPGSAYRKDDCDDTEPRAHGGAVDMPSVCDGVDNDCNGWVADTGVLCVDGGGYCGATGTCGRRKVVEISAGGAHTCGRWSDGTVRCWGGNSSGQLGDDTTTNRLTPTDAANLSGTTEISTGGAHSCARLFDGTVYCWGANSSGQLGDGTTITRRTPVQVLGLNDVAELAAGTAHTCARLVDRTVVCWGGNNNGQIGDGTTNPRLTPRVVTGLTNVAQIDLGDGHSCARLLGGSVRCWGQNYYGQVGDGSLGANRTTPMDVAGLRNVTKIGLGSDHSCAAISDGTVRCWGRGVGPGDRLVPIDVSGVSDVVDLDAGGNQTCTRHGDASVRCWLSGNASMLVSIAPDVVELSTGAEHACARTSDGAVRCWGSNSSGQLGDGSSTPRPNPTPVDGLHGAILEISTGRYHSCTRSSDGTIRCWGDQYDQEVPGPHSTTRLRFDAAHEIASGSSHRCVLLADRTVQCWGGNLYGQLGDGTTNHREAPVAVTSLSNVAQVSSAGDHTCARLDNGTVRCWGRNSNGQLGDGTTTNRSLPIHVPGLTDVVEVRLGSNHTCARRTSGEVRCWGSNRYGAIGDGSVADRATPTVVTGLADVVQLALGCQHTCARLRDGTAYCWGQNRNGELGDGTTSDRQRPSRVASLTNVVALSAGGTSGSDGALDPHYGTAPVGGGHSCAVLSDRTVWCWGSNRAGQIGNGTTTNASTPTQVEGLSGVLDLRSGGAHNCVLGLDESVRCWGHNAWSQIGDSTNIDQLSAQFVDLN